MQKISVILSVFTTYSSLSGMYPQGTQPLLAQPLLAQPLLAQQQLTVHRSCPSLRTLVFAATTMPQLQEKTEKMLRIIDTAKKANKPLEVINAIAKEAHETMGVLRILKEYKPLYCMPHPKTTAENANRLHLDSICSTLIDDNPNLFKLLLWKKPLYKKDVKSILSRDDLRSILNVAFTKNRLWAIAHLLGTVEYLGSTIPIARTAPIDLEMYNELQNLCLSNNSPVIDLENGETVPVLTFIAQHKIKFSHYPIEEQAAAPTRREPSLHEAAYKNDIYALCNHLRTPEGRALLNSVATYETPRKNLANTPLGFAIENNNPEAAELLIKVAKEYKSLTTEEETLSIIKPEFLSAACIEGNPRNVLLLVQNGAPINQKSLETGETSLHKAVYLHTQNRWNCLSLAEYLISLNKADCTIKNNDQETPLHVALHSSASDDSLEDLVNFLIAHGAPFDAQDNNGDTPLHLILKHCLPIDNYCIPPYADYTIANNSKETPFHLAFKLPVTNDVLKNLVDFFIAHGAPFNIQDNDGNTPLHLIIKHCLTIPDYLIPLNADCTITNKNQETPLHVAIKSPVSNDVLKNLVNFLIAHEAPLNVQDSDGNTPLLLIMLQEDYFFPNTTKVDYINLLATKDNINLPNNEKETPLFLAAQAKTVGLLKTLIEHGASLLHKDNDGNTVLHVAAEDGNIAIVKEIIKEMHNQKVDLNVPNNEGDYPIHLAAGAPNRHVNKIVELFLTGEHAEVS